MGQGRLDGVQLQQMEGTLQWLRSQADPMLVRGSGLRRKWDGCCGRRGLDEALRQIKAPCSCYADKSCRVAIRRTSVQQKGGLFIAKGANCGFTGGQKSC